MLDSIQLLPRRRNQHINGTVEKSFTNGRLQLLREILTTGPAENNLLLRRTYLLYRETAMVVQLSRCVMNTNRDTQPESD